LILWALTPTILPFAIFPANYWYYKYSRFDPADATAYFLGYWLANLTVTVIIYGILVTGAKARGMAGAAVSMFQAPCSRSGSRPSCSWTARPRSATGTAAACASA
jgi:hypothetical protein